MSSFYHGKVEADAVAAGPSSVKSQPNPQQNRQPNQGNPHPAHITHYLYWVNLIHTIWSCTGCNKSSTEIKDSECYNCEVCNFYLCRNCSKSKKFLLHRHDLTKTDVRPIYHGSHGRWMCDCCGGNNGLGNYFPRHCNQCKFDLCDKCCEPQRSTLHLHELSKADTRLVYDRFQGGWRCDNCTRRFHPQNDRFPYHCNICEFDLCDDCMRISDAKGASRSFASISYPTRNAIGTTAAGFPVASPEEEMVEVNYRTSSVDDDAKCIICVTKPKDATIIHGGTGHVCCCIGCARELERRGDGCPICREPIQLVIQHFNA